MIQRPRQFGVKFSKGIGLIAMILIAVNAGCSLLTPKRAADSNESAGFTNNVSTNSNEVALPVEINNDIAKIAAGGDHFDSASGKVNVNVNVNFNGNGWQKNVADMNGSPLSISSSGQSTTTSVNGVRSPANAPAATGGGPAGGHTEIYVVKPGDTLMKISFEKYGNVYRWRDILSANKGKIANYSALPAGTALTINGVDYVVIERNGKAYLIERRDTLAKISRHLYGTPSFWRDLWKNNPQLIRNPNKIYAGFTLYYRGKNELGTPVPLATKTPAVEKKTDVAKIGKTAPVVEAAAAPSSAEPVADVKPENPDEAPVAAVTEPRAEPAMTEPQAEPDVTHVMESKNEILPAPQVENEDTPVTTANAAEEKPPTILPTKVDPSSARKPASRKK